MEPSGSISVSLPNTSGRLPSKKVGTSRCQWVSDDPVKTDLQTLQLGSDMRQPSWCRGSQTMSTSLRGDGYV